MTRLAIALTAALLLLAACANESNDTASVEAIDPILASAIEITVDPSATTATLAVDTTIPVACAVIDGSNDTYGSIAVDNDMQGGAHHNHGPLVRNPNATRPAPRQSDSHLKMEAIGRLDERYNEVGDI